MEDEYNKLSIKNWFEEDRPREKLKSKGRSVLTDSELVAILIRSGDKKKSAVELSKSILSTVNNDLNQLAKLTISDFTKFSGIGETKAITIIAALELGRRRKLDDSQQKIKKIRSSKDAFELLFPKLADLPHEEFWIILLSKSNTPILIQNIGKGGISETVADIRIIFNLAITHLASSIILAHNHPSGNLKPSNSDIELTKRIVNAGKILNINVLDHFIIGQQDFFSFADNKYL